MHSYDGGHGLRLHSSMSNGFFSKKLQNFQNSKNRYKKKFSPTQFPALSRSIPAMHVPKVFALEKVMRDVTLGRGVVTMRGFTIASGAGNGFRFAQGSFMSPHLNPPTVFVHFSCNLQLWSLASRHSSISTRIVIKIIKKFITTRQPTLTLHQFLI
jgi:hypothetical protein